MKKSIVVLFHFGYWGTNSLFLWLSTMASLITAGIYTESTTIETSITKIVFPILGYSLIPAIFSFYIFYTTLFLRYLAKKRVLPLILLGILTSVCGVLLGFAFLVLTIGFDAVFHGNFKYFFWLALIPESFLALVHGAAGLMMKAFISWYDDIKIKEELKTKNHEMELALVKSQLDPHFLFNTINNIDILIQKNATKASKYLNSLSDILRFMLFEAKTDKIPLHQEIEYIQKYVNLQKIRTANPDYVNFQIEGETDKLMIAPMLFIPFIENAFKHTSNKKVKNAIEINIKVEENKIVFQCQNRGNENLNLQSETNGLGNELIQKRLQLLYPGSHTLEISKNEDLYKVKLILNNENELHNN